MMTGWAPTELRITLHTITGTLTRLTDSTLFHLKMPPDEYFAVGAAISCIFTFSELYHEREKPAGTREAEVFVAGAIVGLFWPVLFPGYMGVMMSRLLRK
jgi:hypothetical protein